MNGKDARFVMELAATFDRVERYILMLHYAEELTPAEIAAVLEISEDTVIDKLGSIRRRTTDALAGEMKMSA
ncbi:MAG TPA: sigma factor-like helix-turn-helix DNA-binding protein [Phycisphaerales bacterium]|nr:sigma factor-like helix-turn-helix DNA-binding protein [Phycisphaerales bacterium]HRQ75327.1 sigma factor-like helix-turn-helix DNA-binding protein [Phycisphaerales bacterium]